MNIALIGYGKMGKAIEEIAVEQGHSIKLRINSSNPKDLTTENLSSCEVAIEFTGPSSASGNIIACFQAGIPVVSGSTGWLHDLEKITAICSEMNGSFLYASNFSIGVNLFFEINKKLAALMSGRAEYKPEIEEIHHTAKKDAPSGTAITLAEQIIAEQPRQQGWTDKESADSGFIRIKSRRIDPAPGTHHVRYSSAIDDIEIIHTAHNRKGFAGGALLAAQFLIGKKGVFSMKDVLGL